MGRRVEVRETKNQVVIQLDARNAVTHQRVAEAEYQRITVAAHRPPRGTSSPRPNPHPEEQLILQAAPEITDYVTALKQRSRKLVVLALRQLLQIGRASCRERVESSVVYAAKKKRDSDTLGVDGISEA